MPTTPTLFSQRYFRPELGQDDSQRFRVRLAGEFDHVADGDLRGAVVALVKRRLGQRVPPSPFSYDFDAFFAESPLRDVLDTLTLIFEGLAAQMRNHNRYGLIRHHPSSWRTALNLIFQEEHLSYEMADDGSVVRLIDREFSENLTDLVAGLGTARYENVRNSVVKARDYLIAVTPDRKSSVRYIFEAVEILAKMITAKSRLNEQVARVDLYSCYCALNGDVDAHGSAAARLVFQGLADWVNAIQNYRHGQDSEMTVEPTEQMTTFFVASGVTYVRLLADIHSSTKT